VFGFLVGLVFCDFCVGNLNEEAKGSQCPLSDSCCEELLSTPIVCRIAVMVRHKPQRQYLRLQPPLEWGTKHGYAHTCQHDPEPESTLRGGVGSESKC